MQLRHSRINLSQMLGVLCREERLLQQISVSELAQRMGVRESVVAKIEAGVEGDLSIERIASLARGLQSEIWRLLQRAEQRLEDRFKC